MDAASPEEKMALLSAFETGYSRVDELIRDASPDEIRFSPSIRGAWSINAILVHFLDTDLSLAFRARTAIAEPGKALPVWDEESWHEALRYNDEDGVACLGVAKGVRSFLSASIRSVLDYDWAGFFIMHPTKGRMELGSLISTYNQHIAFHLPLIRRNRKAWREGDRP